MEDPSRLPDPGGRSLDLVGKTLGRYRILRLLGVGGMGTVFLAEHMTLGRRTAVKVLNPSMARDPDAIARFHREARNASTIEHPNVCAVYDFGDTPEGLTFLAMEFIEGKPLSDILDESGGTLPPERAARIISFVAEGLHAAHARGIVHRDLKPANIMITRATDGTETVKVVDFGIAKAAAGGEGQDVTRVGLVAGTPQYMSPEHISGDEPDPRSDIYSLAVVFFRTVSGGLPYQADSQAELLRGILTQPPLSLQEARPGLQLPEELQRVMDRALSREPAHRYATAREFAEAIESALGAPLPPTTVFQAPPRRIPRWALGVGAGAVALATITGILLVAGNGGGEEPGPAASISLTPPSVSIRAGGSAQLAASVLDPEGRPLTEAVTVWASEDLEVAAVGPSGLVTAAGPGSTRVSARVDDVVAWASVSVGAPAAASIDVVPDAVRLLPGQSTALTASVTDEEGATVLEADVTWTSDRPDVVSVNPQGLVTGRAAGTATVTAAVDDASGSVTVTVRNREVSGGGGTLRPEDASSELPPLLTLNDAAPRATLLEARSKAEAYWNLGDALETRYRALAAYLVGWTSILLEDQSPAAVERWLQRAVDLDPRESYRQALEEHRRRNR